MIELSNKIRVFDPTWRPNVKEMATLFVQSLFLLDYLKMVEVSDIRVIGQAKRLVV